MARAEEFLFAHHGKHKEDNATKNLCWLLNNLPWNLSQEILKTIFNPVHVSDTVQTIEPSEVTVEAQEDTDLSAERIGDSVLVGLADQTHSEHETDADSFEPSKPPETSRILDLTIEIDGQIVAGVEAKKGGEFNHAQLRDHARELNVSEFGVVTWGMLNKQIQSLLDSDISEVSKNSITGEAISEESSRLLLAEYDKLITDELVLSWEQLGTSPYTTGENSIRLTKDRKPKNKAIDPNEEASEVSFSLVFQSIYEDDDNGGRLLFSPEEWRQLISSMDREYVQAFEEGELENIAEDYDLAGEEVSVAEIENSAGDKKYIRYGDRGSENNEPLLYFNKSTAKGGNLRDIPMYGENGFSEMFGPKSSVTKLFTHPEEILSSPE